MPLLVINGDKSCYVCNGYTGPYFHCPACLGTHCELMPLREALQLLKLEDQEREERDGLGGIVEPSATTGRSDGT